LDAHIEVSNYTLRQVNPADGKTVISPLAPTCSGFYLYIIKLIAGHRRLIHIQYLKNRSKFCLPNPMKSTLPGQQSTSFNKRKEKE
jgi:hypothetical protein